MFKLPFDSFIAEIACPQSFFRQLFLAKAIYNLVARKARGPRVVLAACKLCWPIYIYLFQICIVGICIGGSVYIL